MSSLRKSLSKVIRTLRKLESDYPLTGSTKVEMLHAEAELTTHLDAVELLEKDAELGALIRRMPELIREWSPSGGGIIHVDLSVNSQGFWHVYPRWYHDSAHSIPTPEEALRAALKEQS